MPDFSNLQQTDYWEDVNSPIFLIYNSPIFRGDVTLDRIIEQRGKPVAIRTDNGPEFTSKDLELWSIDNGITLQFKQPGKPIQNAFIERFNRLYREVISDEYLFFDLNEVRVLTEEWIEEYNNNILHESLNNQTSTKWEIYLIKINYILNKTIWYFGYL